MSQQREAKEDVGFFSRFMRSSRRLTESDESNTCPSLVGNFCGWWIINSYIMPNANKLTTLLHVVNDW